MTLGAVVDLDTKTTEILTNSTQEHLENYSNLLHIANCNQFWWDEAAPYAKILGLNVPIADSFQDKLKHDLSFWQGYLTDINKDIDFSEDDWPGIHHVFGGLVSSLAQSRILGVDVPIQKDAYKMMEKTVKLIQDYVPVYFPRILADFAIISAREVKVGPPRGLELTF